MTERVHDGARGSGSNGAAQTVTIRDGRPLGYATYGAPDGRPVVFLHGSPGSRLLGRLFDEPARNHGVSILAVDRPGYGASPAWPDRTPTDVVEGIDAVLTATEATSPGVVAFSGGSRYALALAAASDHDIARVDVLAGSVPPRFQRSPPRVQQVLGRLAELTPRALGALVRGQAWIASHASPAVVTAQYTTGAATDTVTDAVADCVKQDFLEALSGDASAFVHETRRLQAPWRVDTGAIDCDVRFWHGDRDGNVPLAGVRRFVSTLDRATLSVQEDADHLGTLVESRAAVLALQRDSGR